MQLFYEIFQIKCMTVESFGKKKTVKKKKRTLTVENRQYKRRSEENNSLFSGYTKFIKARMVSSNIQLFDWLRLVRLCSLIGPLLIYCDTGPP